MRQSASMRPRKIMNWQARAILYSNNYFRYLIYKGYITFFWLFCRKPWFTEVINISPMDQTKCFQLRTALLWESAYGCMTTRRLIIQWSQKILIIDITKVALRSKASNNSNITWMEYENKLFQSKRVLVPELLTYSREDRLPNRLIPITRIDQTLPIWIKSGPFY